MVNLSNNTEYLTFMHHPHVAEFVQYICKTLNEKHYSKFPDPHLQVKECAYSINLYDDICLFYTTYMKY